MIHETIVTTRNADGTTHIAPMGVRMDGGMLLIAPFRPSRTLENLLRERAAVVNLTDDVRVFAGCLTGRHDWPLCAAGRLPVQRLAGSLSHQELEVRRLEDDELRPRFHCAVIHEEIHAPFRGFNRAQAAVLEAAILVSRLHLLPMDRIQHEMNFLHSAMEKTAGERERAAWSWLEERIAAHRAAQQVRGVAG
jgi:hypothetical protein